MTVRELVAAHATCRMDERRLLMALGLEPTPGRKRPRTRLRIRVRPHDRHTRSAYVPGCPRCQAVHREYVRAWRSRGGPQARTVLRAQPQQLPLFDLETA